MKIENFLTVVIPTKNRATELYLAVNSVLDSTVIPREIIIIDQSTDNNSRNAIKELIKKSNEIKFNYIHNHEINGLVAAKSYALNFIETPLTCFLEDDIVLDKNYLAEIVNGFMKDDEMVGCSGVVINLGKRSTLRKKVFDIFHLGIFLDKRHEIFERYNDYNGKLIKSDLVSGGMSAWKTNILFEIPYDLLTGFHYYEDIEYSKRVSDIYPGKLYINTAARLCHNPSHINRDSIGIGQEKKVIECLKYYRKRKHDKNAGISTFWMILGMLLDSFSKVAIYGRADILYYFMRGLVKGLRLT